MEVGFHNFAKTRGPIFHLRTPTDVCVRTGFLQRSPAPQVPAASGGVGAGAEAWHLTTIITRRKRPRCLTR
jgi:hypothetical protein